MQTNRINQLSVPTNTVLHGDCISLMHSLPANSIDFILTDPPYLVRYQQHEQAYLLAKGNSTLPENTVADVIDMPYSGNMLHPTQKPVTALKPLIEVFTQPGEIVLDPFCGSGSSLLAAKILNRRYLGIELDPHYHAAANKRLHPEGIRASQRVYSPQKEQASRPMPLIGGALQSSAIF